MSSKTFFRQTRSLAILLAGMVSLTAAQLRAQDPEQTPDTDYDQPNGSPEQDPPSRVARLSYVDGSVSFQPGGQGEWGAATKNRPVTIGDKIWSDNNSRAELQAGQASIHLSSMTALSFLNLDEQTIQMRLAEGSLNFRVRELREGDVYEVDTPNLAFNVTEAGAFRVDVNENGDGTRVTVIRGQAQVTANEATYTIHAGERGEFNGTEKVTYLVSAAPTPDEFDRWSNSRDLKEDNSVSARYVSRDVPGYSDLDENGSWSEEPDYGPVWYPTVVDVGWAPYSYGYWNYIGPWGWTWVDYSPWGFAPYHYGRWAYIGSRWGWCPGPYYARPIYGPAFVGFIGGSHWGVGFGFGGGFGGVGWFPLGPHEPFRPWYRASGAYYRNVNVRNTYIRNTNVFANRGGNFNYAYARNAHAVTVASRSNFVNGQAINRGAYHMTEASLRGAQVTNRAGFAPNRQSYLGAAGNHSHIARPSDAIQNRAVMARTAPAAAAAHMPVRSFGGNGQSPRFHSMNAERPAFGRAAQTAAAQNNRPSFAGRADGSGQFGGVHAGGSAQANRGTSPRQRELSLDKPSSHLRNAPNVEGFNRGSRGATGNPRNASPEGGTVDRGRVPSGFGANAGGSRAELPSRNTSTSRSDRPSWATGNSRPGERSGYSVRPRATADRPSDSNRAIGGNRSYTPPRGSGGYAADRSSDSNRGFGGNRSYSPPQRSSGGYAGERPSPSYGSNRGPSQPRSYPSQPRPYSPRSYSAAPRGNSQPRSYSAPRSYSGPSAPARSYSAPSRGSGAGGGSYRGGGGGGRPSGGVSSHGGGSPHGGRH
jgi:hypothetical protein